MEILIEIVKPENALNNSKIDNPDPNFNYKHDPNSNHNAEPNL
jgi:hypothetical protein